MPQAQTADSQLGRMPMDITVRAPEFDFSGDVDLEIYPGNPDFSATIHGFSMTMPHLEPYLIRTMRTAAKEIEDKALLADLRAFSAQEANHYRNHIAMNDAIKRKVGPDCTARLETMQAQLEADYQDFSKNRSLEYNTAYAEGFEVMTYAGARTMAKNNVLQNILPWARDLWMWHIAEESEHRTVAFDVFEHLFGGYWVRMTTGMQAQRHFVKSWFEMADEICIAMTGSKVDRKKSRTAMPGSLRDIAITWLPTYNPHKFAMDQKLTDFLQNIPAAR